MHGVLMPIPSQNTLLHSCCSDVSEHLYLEWRYLLELRSAQREPATARGPPRQAICFLPPSCFHIVLEALII